MGRGPVCVETKCFVPNFCQLPNISFISCYSEVILLIFLLQQSSCYGPAPHCRVDCPVITDNVPDAQNLLSEQKTQERSSGHTNLASWPEDTVWKVATIILFPCWNTKSWYSSWLLVDADIFSVSFCVWFTCSPQFFPVFEWVMKMVCCYKLSVSWKAQH